MHDINRKALLFGYLSYFIPAMLCTLSGAQFGLLNILWLILGGYVAAQLSPGREWKHAVALGCVAFVISVVMALVIFGTTGENYTAAHLLGDLGFALLICFLATALGGYLRLLVKKRFGK